MSNSSTRYTARVVQPTDKSDISDILSHHIREENLDSYSLPFDRFLDQTDSATLFVATDPETERVIGITALYEYPTVKGVIDALCGVELPTVDDLRDGESFSGVGYIATAYVHPDHLRTGAGRVLREQIEVEAERRGLDAIFAEVWGYDEDRDGRRPLRRSGYEEVFWSDQYWPASVPGDSDALCSACGSDCSCIGAIYYKRL